MTQIYRSLSIYRALPILLLAAISLLSGEASANPEVPENSDNPPPVITGNPRPIKPMPAPWPGGGRYIPEPGALSNGQITISEVTYDVHSSASLDVDVSHEVIRGNSRPIKPMPAPGPGTGTHIPQPDIFSNGQIISTEETYQDAQSLIENPEFLDLRDSQNQSFTLEVQDASY